VTIDTQPQGAAININGEDRGTTPMKLSLTPSTYSVKLTKTGFNTLTTSIDVIKEGEAFNFDLTKTEDAISVTTIPEGADVYIDGNFIGKSSLKYRRDLENIHKVKVLLQGFREQEKIVDFSKERDIIFNLEKNFFKVKVTTIPPGSVIYVDENYKGETPTELELSEGDHDLRLVLSGRKSIIKKIKVTTPLELEYSFESDGFAFETTIGEESAPGARVFMFHMKDGTVNTKIPPLFVGKTPVTRSINDIMTYITADLSTKHGLIVANHPTLGSYAGIFDLDEGGKPVLPKFVMELSGISPALSLGQPVENIDFNSIATNPEAIYQNALSNKRFKLIDQGSTWFLIDRDNIPYGKMVLDGKPETLILSGDESHIVSIAKGQATLMDVKTSKRLKTVPGTGAYFTPDGEAAVVYDKNRLTSIDLKTLEQTISYAPNKGRLIPANSDYAIDCDGGKVTGFINIKTGAKDGWNEIFTENPFDPMNVVIRNIAGDDTVLVLGKVFGVQALVRLDKSPVILYQWIPENAVQKLTNPNL
jgi:hypothetical protein